jgi:hypothetical protein
MNYTQAGQPVPVKRGNTMSVSTLRIIDADETAKLLPFSELVPALRQAFAEGCVVPTRHQHTIANEGLRMRPYS